jgi:hypothetical protein
MKDLKLFIDDVEYLASPVAEGNPQVALEGYENYNRFEARKSNAAHSTYSVLLPNDVWDRTSWFVAYWQKPSGDDSHLNRLFCFLK